MMPDGNSLSADLDFGKNERKIKVDPGYWTSLSGIQYRFLFLSSICFLTYNF